MSETCGASGRVSLPCGSIGSRLRRVASNADPRLRLDAHSRRTPLLYGRRSFHHTTRAPLHCFMTCYTQKHHAMCV